MTTLSPESVRAELAAWVAEYWDPDRPLREWRELLADSGWAAPSWPERWYGRGWPAWADDVVAAGLIELGAAGTPTGLGMTLAAPTLLACPRRPAGRGGLARQPGAQQPGAGGCAGARDDRRRGRAAHRASVAVSG
jgi:alkylation response protein AidB-like acyl-CoA dehydrogenase